LVIKILKCDVAVYMQLRYTCVPQNIFTMHGVITFPRQVCFSWQQTC